VLLLFHVIVVFSISVYFFQYVEFLYNIGSLTFYAMTFSKYAALRLNNLTLGFCKVNEDLR